MMFRALALTSLFLAAPALAVKPYQEECHFRVTTQETENLRGTISVNVQDGKFVAKFLRGKTNVTRVLKPLEGIQFLTGAEFRRQLAIENDAQLAQRLPGLAHVKVALKDIAAVDVIQFDDRRTTGEYVRLFILRNAQGFRIAAAGFYGWQKLTCIAAR